VQGLQTGVVVEVHVPVKYCPLLHELVHDVQAAFPLEALKVLGGQLPQVLSEVPPQVLDNCWPAGQVFRQLEQVRSTKAVPGADWKVPA